MTKTRQPFTTHDAVHIAIGELGLEAATKVAGYQQPTTMYAFGNPEKERDISFDSAVALDIACYEGGGLTPFFDVYKHKLDGLRMKEGLDIPSALLDIHQDAAELAARVRAAAAASSPGGAAYTAAEKAGINAEGMELINEIKMILAVVNGGEDGGAKRSASLFERFTKQKADEEAA